MSKPVRWVIEFALPPGKDKEVRALMGEMVEGTRANEPGTLNYEWFISDDGLSCHVYELYRDSEAALVHMDNVGKHYAARMLAIVKPTRFMVYGDPSDALKKALGALGPVFLKSYGGFSR